MIPPTPFPLPSSPFPYPFPYPLPLPPAPVPLPPPPTPFSLPPSPFPLPSSPTNRSLEPLSNLLNDGSFLSRHGIQHLPIPHRIGKRRSSDGKPIQIIARFLKYPDREAIMSNAGKLKGLEYRRTFQRKL